MIDTMFGFLRSYVIPRSLFRFLQPYYHYILALLGAVMYRFPSRQLVVIGITGTKGKTSTAQYVWAALSGGGYKVGAITTANFRNGLDEEPNNAHMTMPGRFFIQKRLRELVDSGCTHVVIEVTSEGILQHRHLFIEYDIAIATNLSPEHLASHNNSFEEYKTTKGKLFALISKASQKNLSVTVPNAIITNGDDEHNSYYASFEAKTHATYSIHNDSLYQATDVVTSLDETKFSVGGFSYHVRGAGIVQCYNALPAIIVAKCCGMSDEEIQKGFDLLTHIPGRMEQVHTKADFTVIVDYAHEKLSMGRLAHFADDYRKSNPGSKWIVMVGAEGGGRDKAKRKDIGEVVGASADIVVLSSTDPYEEDPHSILEDIALHVEKAGKRRGIDEFIEVDRKKGIEKCIALARSGDLVTITGNGSQIFMHVAGKKVPHNDKEYILSLLGVAP